MTKYKIILFFTSLFFFGLPYAQVVIKEKDFTSKNILAQIFDGEFQEELNVQKWPVSKTQALELNSSYIDFTKNAYTLVDTILTMSLDTGMIKIVVFKTMQVDSSGWIQDYIAAIPKMGLAMFSSQNGSFKFESFKLDVINEYHDLITSEYRLESIGPSDVVVVFKEETHQDLGKEFWIKTSHDFGIYLTYDYISLVQGEKSTLIENSIEIVPTENQLYDLFLISKITPTDVINSDKVSKAKPLRTKLIYNNSDMMQHVQLPFGYSIQPK